MIESLDHTAALNDRLLAACAYALGKSGNVHKAHMHAQLVGLAGAACLDQPVSDARTTNNEVKRASTQHVPHLLPPLLPHLRQQCHL